MKHSIPTAGTIHSHHKCAFKVVSVTVHDVMYSLTDDVLLLHSWIEAWPMLAISLHILNPNSFVELVTYELY